ncbi:MAG: histidine--tRNA ligase [Chloroflexi bacterium]|nr:histidine--tRNA ligase [Chloroflexota bacterium]
MAELQAPRGMHDLLPEEEPLWRLVRDTCERVARGFGYGFITTPIVEDERVFLRSVGDESDIVQKEMYLFEDRGGGRLALRPEATAAVCRAYLEHGMGSRPQPVRLAYFGPMFRYDRPQAGRYRQLWQFGVECIGDASPAADVEVIELQHALYGELGLKGIALRINSIGTAETRERYEQTLREHLAPHAATLSKDSQRRLAGNVLRVLDSKEDAANPALASAPSIADALDEGDREHFAEVQRLLDALGIAYDVDHRIVRGLDYYARTVWEFEPAGGGGQSTVGAGGRYDGLMELLGGPPTPGTGFATGIERIVLNLRAQGVEAQAAGVDVVTVPLGEAGAAWAMRVAARLRHAGLAVRGGTPGRSLSAQLRAANKSGARFALIAGDDEAAQEVGELKALTSDDPQRRLDIEALLEAVKPPAGAS